MSPAFIGTALEVDRLAEGLGAVYEFRPPARCELDHRRVYLGGRRFPKYPGRVSEGPDRIAAARAAD